MSNHECMNRNITSTRRMPGIEEQLELAGTGEELCHASSCSARANAFVFKLPEALCQAGYVCFDTWR